MRKLISYKHKLFILKKKRHLRRWNQEPRGVESRAEPDHNQGTLPARVGEPDIHEPRSISELFWTKYCYFFFLLLYFWMGITTGIIRSMFQHCSWVCDLVYKQNLEDINRVQGLLGWTANLISGWRGATHKKLFLCLDQMQMTRSWTTSLVWSLDKTSGVLGERSIFCIWEKFKSLWPEGRLDGLKYDHILQMLSWRGNTYSSYPLNLDWSFYLLHPIEYGRSDVVQLLSPELRKFTASVLVLLVLGEYCTVIKPTVKGYMESPSHPNCSYHSYLQAQTWEYHSYLGGGLFCSNR